MIPKKRLLTYLIVASLIPIGWVTYGIIREKQELNRLSQSIESVQLQALSKEKKQGMNLSVREHYKNSDHFYIDKHLETIPLLEPEIEGLKKVLNQHHLVENEAAKKRLEQLQSQNKISFTEGVVQTYPYFHETTETLNRPIEVNLTDLKTILSRIENVEIDNQIPGPNPPQLIISDFKIDKKKTGDNNEVFQLNMKLIKREYF